MNVVNVYVVYKYIKVANFNIISREKTGRRLTNKCRITKCKKTFMRSNINSISQKFS